MRVWRKIQYDIMEGQQHDTFYEAWPSLNLYNNLWKLVRLCLRPAARLPPPTTADFLTPHGCTNK
jgi:hypothetical protein